MIDRALNNMRQIQQESYYFQLIPLSLSIVNKGCELPAVGTTYKFTISKGQQKFDENKIPIEATFQVAGKVPVLVINSCRLNFFVPNYSKQRKQDFSLAMVQRENNEDYELGEFKVTVDDLVSKFKEGNTVRHEFKANFTEDYELDFQVYIEKNRMNLQRNIRDNKTERINKSPLRTRKDERGPSPQIPPSIKKEDAPSRDKDQQIATENIEETNKQKSETAFPKIEVNTSPRAEEFKRSPPISESPNTKMADKSQKEAGSVKSKESLPVIQTKYKQLSRGGTPSEVRMTESVRLGNETQVEVKKSTQDSLKDKVLLWAFLLASFVVMYVSMHPNKKV